MQLYSMVFISLLYFLPLYSTGRIEPRGKKLVEESIILVGFHLFHPLVHELSHIVQSEFFVAMNFEMDNKNQKTKIWLNSFCRPFSATYRLVNNPYANTISTLSGPVGGILGTYLFVKAYNIYTEYKKNKPFKKAVRDGYSKNFLNNDQSLAFKTLIAIAIGTNIAACLPFNTLFPKSMQRKLPCTELDQIIKEFTTS